MPLEGDIRNLLTITVHNGMVLEAEKATISMQQHVQMLRAGGMTDAAIRELMIADFHAENSALFSSYKNGVRELITGGVHQSYQLGVTNEYLSSYGDEAPMKWTVESDNPCDDCAARAGEVDTLRNWTIRGMPKSGFSRCGRRCLCSLTPEEMNAPATVPIEESV
jgi:hypothetical protein